MAYTNLFKVFAQNSSNLVTDAEWSTNAERTSGFISGAVSKSANVNTAIKSNSLVTVALMDFIATYGTGTRSLGLTSSTTDIKDALLNVLQNNFSFVSTANQQLGDTLSLKMFNSTAKNITVTNSAHANSTANLDAAGQLGTRGDEIFVTVGGKKSNDLTVPYAVRAMKDENGNDIKSKYGTSLVSGNEKNTVMMKSRDDTTLSTVTIDNVDNAKHSDASDKANKLSPDSSQVITVNITQEWNSLLNTTAGLWNFQYVPANGSNIFSFGTVYISSVGGSLYYLYCKTATIEYMLTVNYGIGYSFKVQTTDGSIVKTGKLIAVKLS